MSHLFSPPVKSTPRKFVLKKINSSDHFPCENDDPNTRSPSILSHATKLDFPNTATNPFQYDKLHLLHSSTHLSVSDRVELQQISTKPHSVDVADIYLDKFVSSHNEIFNTGTTSQTPPYVCAFNRTKINKRPFLLIGTEAGNIEIINTAYKNVEGNRIVWKAADNALFFVDWSLDDYHLVYNHICRLSYSSLLEANRLSRFGIYSIGKYCSLCKDITLQSNMLTSHSQILLS
jgi:hypothetical protein